MTDRTRNFKKILWRNFQIRHTAPAEQNLVNEDAAMRRKRALDVFEEQMQMSKQREVWE